MRYYLDFDTVLFNLETQSLYVDAASFLREKENAVTIIVGGERAMREESVKKAIYGIPRMAVMYTEREHKGKYLAPHTHLHADAVLVDGSVRELEGLAVCPKLGLYEMRRDGTPGSGKWPVIKILSELP